MDERKTIRIWQWSVALLVLCNIALMLFIWLKKCKPADEHGHGDGRPRGARNFIIEKLKMTDEQVKQYDVLIAGHRKSMRMLDEEARGYRQALFNNLRNGSQGGGQAADSLSQLIANTQKKIELVTFKHFETVKTIFTNEQKAEFDNIVEDVMHKMAGKDHRPPDGPPGGDGGRPDGPPDGEHGPGDGPPPPPPRQ